MRLTVLLVKMNEYLDNAKEELKRVDHLIFVSLKYTRTVDVLKSIIERLINAFDEGILYLLEYLIKKNKIKSYPKAVLMRCDLIKEKIKDDNIKEYIELYLFLRKISKAKFTKRMEYRRHVTMIADMDGNFTEINMDNLKENYKKTHEFIDYIKDNFKVR